MTTSTNPYPLRYTVDYPDRPLDRTSSFFRIFTVIPIAIVLGTITGLQSEWIYNIDPQFRFILPVVGLSAGALFVGPLLMILFRQKYPRWWFDFNLQLTRLSARVLTYISLMRDEYPSTEDEQAVHLEMDYPDVPRDLNRWLPLVKWFLAIPHYFILYFLEIAALIMVIAAWFAILFTGRYPRGIFDFVLGVQRWGLRVEAYSVLLITDRYPPFSLD